MKVIGAGFPFSWNEALGSPLFDQTSTTQIKKKGIYQKQPKKEAVWGHWEVIGIGEPTSDQKLRPIVAVRGHCGLGSLFVEQMFKFENLFILVVWIFPLFSILLSLTADNWVRKVCVPSILSLEFSKLGVPLFLMIAATSVWWIGILVICRYTYVVCYD